MNSLNYNNNEHSTTKTITSSMNRPGLIDNNRNEPFKYDYTDYICGFGAAIANVYVTFPINKLIFRQMLHGQSVRTATATLRSEGIGLLYRGVAPPLIQRSLTLSLMFGTFGTYQKLLETYSDQIFSSSVRFCLSAFLAGSTEAIMCPLERIQMLLQVFKYIF